VSLPGLLLRQTRYALVGFRRNPRAMVLTVVMPIVLLVLFASVFTGKTRTTRVDGLLIGIDAYFTAGIAAYSIMLIGFSSLLISIVTAREGGLLKRYRGTPMPSGVFLAAQILQTMVTIAVMVAVLLAIGAIAYDVELDATAVFAFVVYVVVGTATMCALGLALSRVATSVDVASTIGPFIAVILAFISGVFVPVTELPQWLVDVGRVFPLAHLAEGLQRALTPAAQGSRIDAGNLAVLALWGFVAMAVAIRRFRWEPLAAGT
jgi:ABC-2 type transport system permease protein